MSTEYEVLGFFTLLASAMYSVFDASWKNGRTYSKSYDFMKVMGVLRVVCVPNVIVDPHNSKLLSSCAVPGVYICRRARDT